MNIGFYKTATPIHYAFGLLSKYDMPWCEKCHAFHYEGNPCITEEMRIELLPQVKKFSETFNPETIIHDAYGVEKRGLVKGWGQDLYATTV